MIMNNNVNYFWREKSIKGIMTHKLRTSALSCVAVYFSIWGQSRDS